MRKRVLFATAAIVLVGAAGFAAASAIAGNGPGPPSGDANHGCSPSTHWDGTQCTSNGDGAGNCGQNQGNGQGGNDNGYGHEPDCSEATTTAATSGATTTTIATTAQTTNTTIATTAQTTNTTIATTATTGADATTKETVTSAAPDSSLQNTTTAQSTTTTPAPFAPPPVAPSAKQHALTPESHRVIDKRGSSTHLAALPFTGLPLWPFALAFALTVAAGLGLRRTHR